MSAPGFGIRPGLRNSVVSGRRAHTGIERGQIWGAASRATTDQDMMREQQRFGDDCAQATGAQEYHKGDEQVDGEDGGFAHGANRTMTASARKTAPHRRIPSYCKIASHTIGAPVALLVAFQHDVVRIAIVVVGAPGIAVAADLHAARAERGADRLSGQQALVARSRQLRRRFVVDRRAAADGVAPATLEACLSDACEPVRLRVGGQRLPAGRDYRETRVGKLRPRHSTRAGGLPRRENAVLAEDAAASDRVVLVTVAVTGVMHELECSGEQQRQDLERTALIGVDVPRDLDDDSVLLRWEIADGARHRSSLEARAR